ncbi:autotransporter outer membrane beta-barrel domain-containing protein [Limnobaculum xujianqingii]|uniref:autotransporter outer membrane beta-barrel domain-containing protein n=1 Tax=Limnobaculum xujianqingii TaxID=2738837 RepID=UPI00112CE14D|nr:autotransporter outer membrane beta-barrel domain-containing protein [Limnobaculum xujianqingii]
MTNGISAHGMHAETNTGDIKMLNQSTIDTLGDDSRGISAQLKPVQGQVAKGLLMDNLGQINAQSHGMYVESSGPVGSFLVRNAGTINARDGSGIQATAAAGNVTVQATNQINAGQSSAEGTHHGIYAATGANGKASVTYDSGTITLSPVSTGITPTGVGIWVDDLATGNTNTAAEINFNNGFINAEQGAGGIGMSLSGTGNINIGKTALVHGGDAFGIGLGSTISSEKTRLMVNNYGVVDAISDRVIYSTANAGQVTVNNYNQLTGSAQFGSADNTINNYNRFLLRNYSDSNRDGLRDNWGIASVDMGNGGNNTFINKGTLVLANSANYAINPVSANEIYVPVDLTSSYANTATLTQGQMLGVTLFDHSGVIDLTDGTTNAGNSLVITGGHTPGKNGGGTFVSNGGRVVANMKADDKGKTLFSDVMVVDSARLGTGGPTTVEINHLGENTAIAPKSQVLVVESLSKSDAGAFQLSTGRQLFGVSDYELEYNTANNNWYLNTDYRSEIALASTVFPVANDYAYTMLGSLDTRRGPQHARNTPPQAQIVQSGGDACKKEGLTAKEEVELLISGMCTPKVVQAQARSDNSAYIPEAWGRIIGKKTEHGSGDIEKNGAGYDSYLSGIQLGHDIYRREGADSSMDRTGVYFGYGDTETDINNDRGQGAGSTVTKAYSLGLYWTHQGQQNWYTDTVLQTTYYDVDATSKHSETFSTNGVGVLGSVEGGYAFNFNNGLTVEPQAQLAYQHISFDDAKDNHGSFSFKQNDSLRARTGLLVDRDWSLAKDSDSKPHYLRTWAKTDIWHEFMGDATTYAVDKTGKHSTQLKQPSNGTWAEVSVGANYQYNESMGYSAAGSYSKSLDDRDNKSWGGQLGVNVKW